MYLLITLDFGQATVLLNLLKCYQFASQATWERAAIPDVRWITVVQHEVHCGATDILFVKLQPCL